MSAEAIERITELERSERARCERAAQESKQKVLAVRRALERQLADSRKIAETEARRLLVESETEAAEEAERILAAAGEECEEIKRAARERLDAAARRIVERVVSD